MVNKLVTGVIPPMITVFNDDETIDERHTRDHVNFLINSGVHAIAVGGTVGEFIALTVEERKQLIELVVNEVNGRVPVYAGTGHYSTRITIELSKFAERVGANALLVILPYYLRPPRRFVFDHYRAVREAVNLPLILYNGLDFAGYHLSPAEVAQLVEEGVIQGVKENHPDVSTIRMLKHLCGSRLVVYSGPDSTGFEALCAGADGWFGGVLLNLLPDLCVELYSLFIQGRMVEARAIWEKVFPLIRLLTVKKENDYPHFIQIVKAGLNILGRHGGKPARPLLPLDDVEADHLAMILAQLGKEVVKKK
jgi:4-hydroxy-tetrahydrodipicolinate synthase